MNQLYTIVGLHIATVPIHPSQEADLVLTGRYFVFADCAVEELARQRYAAVVRA